MRLVSLCVAVVVLWSGDALAIDPTRHVSQYVHRHVDARGGGRDRLPQNLANSIVQTADGYLWAGTEQGLSRYDGQTFTTFDRTSGLPAKTISALASAGRVMWIGTRDRGLAMLEDGVFRVVSDDAFGLQIRALAIDGAGDVWVGTRDRGVSRLHDGRVVQTLRAHDGLPSDEIREIAVARDGSVWIGTFAGAAHITNGRATAGPSELATVTVSAIVEDRGGDIWFGSTAGLGRLHGGVYTTIELPPGEPLVTRLFVDHHGNLWVGRTRSLLRRIDKGSDDKNNLIEELRLDTRVLAIAEDRQGDLWIGTELGLDELSDGAVLPFGAAEGLTDEAVYGVLEDRGGTVWVGATGGLFRLVANTAVNVAAEHGTVYAIHEDPHGDVWAGARDGSIGRWRGDKFAWVATTTWEQVRAIEDAHDGFWIGTDHGLFRSQGDDIEHARSIVAGQIVTSVVVDRSGGVWFGTEGGGLRHITETGEPAAIPAGGPPASSAIMMLSFDTDGALWATCDGEGLWRLAGDRWTVVTKEVGLIDDTIWRVLDDGAGSLWMSSDRGVARVPRDKVVGGASFRSVVFGESDGMRRAECNGSFSPAGWHTRDGRLMFPTASGLAVIDPRHVDRSEPQPAFVESIEIDGQAMPATPAIVVPAGTSRLDFDFTVVELHAPDRVKFRYKLEPFDDGWREPRHERLAEYTNLAPGRYKFVVEAAIDDVWARGQTIEVTLEPLFYQTNLFRIGAILVAVLAILAVPLVRVRQLRARERELALAVQAALRDVKTLSGLIPICAWCKKIRDDKGYWNLLEAYLTERTDAKLTHGICPTCVRKQEEAEDEADRAAERRR